MIISCIYCGGSLELPFFAFILTVFAFLLRLLKNKKDKNEE